MSKKWYAVQVDLDPDCETGSTNYREALRMATAAHKLNPTVEVGICTTTIEKDHCLDYQVIYKRTRRYTW